MTAPQPVYLTAQAINNLLLLLPAGSDFFFGVVLIVMLTGQLAATKGSLARAVYPLVAHLRWGWHRCERVFSRACFSLDTLFEAAYQWCLRELAAEPVRLGPWQREVQALDTSTIARFRALRRLGAAGKGYWGRAGKAVRANLVATINSVVLVNGLRLGLVRRTRFGATCEAAVASLFAALPPCLGPRLVVVDAGIATKEQFAAATEKDALLGRLRSNVVLRGAPAPKAPGQRGPHPKHGPHFHPGRAVPELPPTEELSVQVRELVKGQEEERTLRIRRWSTLHFETEAQTILEVVRVDDPHYDKPLLLGTTARELRTADFLPGYQCRATIETNFYVGQDTAAMEMPRAFSETAVPRRISLALLAGSLLKAIAAKCEPLSLGPWDKQPQQTAGRLAHYLHLHTRELMALALRNAVPRNYRKKETLLDSKNFSAGDPG